ncbi:MAG: DUF2970 domain-containing protein [Gammaproteobacteria bacterium]|nr:DUF2970 domain-containing protein [Gammaproteobacteria bacterium]
MWINRIISSFFGIRKKSDLNNDLNNITLKKIVILFVLLNILFISAVLLITKVFI